MPRKLEFDPDDVLEKAMYAFWKRGVEHTSVSDLVAATGVQRSGLYGVFGSKEALFERSLRLYIDSVVKVNFGRFFDKTDTDIEDLKRYFANYSYILEKPVSINGCLMCNTAISKSSEARVLNDEIAKMFTEIKGFFETALRNTREKGLLTASSSDTQIAESLLASVVALSTLCRSPNGRSLVNSYVAELLDRLDTLGPRGA